jgi:hypothetical protein
LAGPPAGEPTSAEQESLSDVIFGLEDAMLALVDEGRATDSHHKGVDLALQPVYAYNEADAALDKQKLVNALKPWDEGWEQWPPEIQDGMAPAGQRLDEFLLAAGIEPARPPIGVAYDPRTHGAAIDVEASELPKDAIVRLLYRGYRDTATGAWLREPAVVVSSGRPPRRQQHSLGEAT